MRGKERETTRQAESEAEEEFEKRKRDKEGLSKEEEKDGEREEPKVDRQGADGAPEAPAPIGEALEGFEGESGVL